ncbi:MAG: hypothetical protein U0Y68_20330 [Blastocatellia bacterium]
MPIPLYGAFIFWLGGVAALLIAREFGPRLGLLAAVIAASETGVFGRSLTLSVVFGAEAYFLGLAARRNLAVHWVASIIYWLIAGVPGVLGIEMIFYKTPRFICQGVSRKPFSARYQSFVC